MKKPSTTLTTTTGKQLSPKLDRARKINHFLLQLRAVPNVERAAARAGIPVRTAYDWRANDARFKERWDRAMQESLERLEELAFKRAKHKDSQLLQWLLRCHKPDPYDPSIRHEVKGAVAGVIIVPPKEDKAP